LIFLIKKLRVVLLKAVGRKEEDEDEEEGEGAEEAAVATATIIYEFLSSVFISSRE